MQALEMEQAESLTGKHRRRARTKIGNGKSGNNASTSCLASMAQTRSFVGKVVVVAALTFLLMMGLASHSPDDGKSGDGPAVAKPAVSNGSANVDNGVAATAQPNASPTTKVTAAPVPTTAPVPAAAAAVATTPTQSGALPESRASEGFSAYSKFATIVPMPQVPLPEETQKEALGAKWGHWHFWDGDEDTRPPDDFTAKFPNRDVTAEEFPEDAWQGDAVFVNHILNDADQLITRAMEAIFTEYGHGKPLPNEKLAERMKMFHWDKVDLATQTTPPSKYGVGGSRGNGGWTTRRSYQGLVRRLLHAMMTQDTFTVVMGGHSAAVGQGNHFRQSYMMQFHKILQPIFARVGVKLITRNMGQGGMGTSHSAMGSGSIYGNCDLLIWDSGMTEKGDLDLIDLFLRQGLLSGDRVPVVWGGNFEVLRHLHENADVDVGEVGTGMDGVIMVESEAQAKTIPWAARYMACADSAKDLCTTEPRFCAKCWIDRDDGVKPTTGQRDSPRGQVKWHPGWRSHQLQGRVLAFSVLDALSAAVNEWSEGTMGGPPLADDAWHVTDYYNNIRTKLRNLNDGHCKSISDKLPERMCTVPMQARTQYTPRANPEQTSLTSIIKPTSDGWVPKNNAELLYTGPDAHNTCYDIPDGELDVYAVVAGRRRHRNLEAGHEDENGTTPRRLDITPALTPQHNLSTDGNVGNSNTQSSTDTLYATDDTEAKRQHRQLDDAIVPGKGWGVFDEPAGYCDGTFDAVCALQADNECALYGHHDARGALVGNELSGWLVMKLSDLVEGIIVLKLHTWHTDNESTLTQGWTSVNNQRTRNLRESPVHHQTSSIPQERNLMRSYDTPELPDAFVFEYAINGKITSLNKKDFLEKKKQVQRVVETITLLDDASFTSKPQDVEVAVRMRNCGRQCTFGVSHIYWA
mmetsp:Transcript_17057/g.47915  ORF Transcript_17057/g.47915 Transcript_17057/m.47915 type:complete len:918 (+) Transcript_17057:96-2849(+)